QFLCLPGPDEIGRNAVGIFTDRCLTRRAILKEQQQYHPQEICGRHLDSSFCECETGNHVSLNPALYFLHRGWITSPCLAQCVAPHYRVVPHRISRAKAAPSLSENSIVAVFKVG